jgi:hypothetical protein
MRRFFTFEKFPPHLRPMVRRDLLIWGLLAVAVAMGVFVSKTRRLFIPSTITLQSENTTPSANLPLAKDFPAEWVAPDKEWDLFAPSAMEPGELQREVVEERVETPPNLAIEGHIAMVDGPAYVILRNATTGQLHRLARRDAIPDTDFTVMNFHSDGAHLAVKISDGSGRCFTISTNNDSDASAPLGQNTHP